MMRAILEGGARCLRMQIDAFFGEIEMALAFYATRFCRVQRGSGVPVSLVNLSYVAAILARLSTLVRR